MNLKNIRYAAEFLIVKFGLWFFGAMKPQTASNVASSIAKFVGKKIAVNKLAYKNLSSAMPELNEAEKEKILDDMWDNLGRIVGEYAHIAACSVEDIESLIEEMSQESRANIEAAKKSGKGGIIFGAHIGNWEVGPKLFMKAGLQVSTVYRPLNNPYVEELTAKMRGVELIGKSTSGSRKIIDVIRKGGFVIILADQKVSEGEPVKFFHAEAITTTSIARIGLKYDVPLIPARSIRLGKNFKFRVEVEKPLAFEKTGDVNFDLLQLTRSINCKLEEWIRQYPAQWFWVHNRWKR
ncbi:MAG: lysophospholipid acyltransferase family protein [Rickettsiales bacterium]|nr:lysophospholipid acyltransferase family protein [Rickettsiales bacterium]